VSESTSATMTVTAPLLTGVWVFDPTDAIATERNFIFAEGRVESIDAGGVEIVLAGRQNPLVEYGEQTLVGLSLTVFLPFSEAHDAEVQYWRDVVTSRRAVCYRDNRERLVYGALKGELSIADGRAGTAIGVELRRVDYSTEVI